MSEDIKKIVLAYSGGLDTSVILAWLKESYQCPVIAFAADLGQGDDLKDIEKKAIETGAEDVIIEEYFEYNLTITALDLIVFYILPIAFSVGVILFYKNKLIKHKLLKR